MKWKFLEKFEFVGPEKTKRKLKYQPSNFKWKKFGSSSSTYISEKFTTKTVPKSSYLPVTPGCYEWWYKGELLYIGTSTNLRNRLGPHIKTSISGPKGNSAYSTTTRDAIMYYLFPEHKDKHLKYRGTELNDKKNNPDYLKLWDLLNEVIANSEFRIYSTKTVKIAHNLELKLITKYTPPCNGAVPKVNHTRNDEKVIGEYLDA